MTRFYFIAIFTFVIALPPVFGFTARMHDDWLAQDAAEPAKCFTDTTGNAVEVQLLQKVLTELKDGGTNSGITARLNELQTQNVHGSDPRWRQLYWDACAERRKIRLQFVRKHYPVIVYTKHDILGGSHYSYTESPTDAQFRDRLIAPGASLISLSIGEDGTLSEKVLVKAPERGTLRDPDVSFDGKTIAFSMRNDVNTDDYHLYDYDTETGKVRQLTFGNGFADIEPCYLPDGNILFPSTRCMQIVDCWWTDVVNLYCCDKDGRFLRRIGFDQVHTNYPKVLPDGRITYTRWDYNDRGQIFPHGLFMMNYDGTGQIEYHGNNSFFPTSILHARGVPNSNKVVAVASGHHTLQKGKLILIDRSKGTVENQGVQLIAPIRETKAERIDAYGQQGDQFQYPLPLDEDNFIAAYSPLGKHHYGLYYINTDNTRRELLAFDASSPVSHCGQPVPLKPRTIPMLRTSPVDYTKKTGTFYVQDVYEGPGLAGVERGTVKELRVVALEFRAGGIEKNGNHGPAGGALVSTPIAVDNGSWDVKRVLGTVPVEKDGSAYFEVPAQTPVYFQLLNKHGETVQTMRSWSVLQPGEMFSCIGCHEPKAATMNNPESRGGTIRTLALRREPKKPVDTLAAGLSPQTGFSFAQTIQPILDANCVSCHIGGKKDDGSPAPFSLLGKAFVPTQERKVNMAGRQFSESYINLTQGGKANEFVNWLGVQLGPPMVLPNTAGAVKSKLPRMFDSSFNLAALPEYHKDIVLSDTDCRKIAMWIDLLVPFSGSYTDETSWTNAQKSEYAYYQMKRDKMAAIERENVEKYIQYRNGGALPPPEAFAQFTEGGIENKKKFLKEK
ncbi:MAG: hypothetical protein LBN39_11670 [Planctomycetaceae bacterium]|jgi:hypothetical protein|nr:hypothetical protein [Planctomycetaceae bacterium]